MKTLDESGLLQSECIFTRQFGMIEAADQRSCRDAEIK